MFFDTQSIGVRAGAIALSLTLVGCGLSPVPYEDPSNTEPAPVETPVETPKDTQELTTEPDVEPEVVDDGEMYALTDMAMESGAAFWEPDFNTEEYGSVEESGFVSTAVSPLSTLSADVDTASYANLRRMLRDGYVVADPADELEDDGQDGSDEEDFDYWNYYGYGDTNRTIPAGAVRIEEMLNYFDYDYETPTDDEGFAITARVGACPWNADTQLLVLGFATPHESPTVAENGSNLVFLIDVSGSMDDADKLPLLQSAFGDLVETLDENDVVSIVTYSGEEEIVLDGASGADHTTIMRAVRSLDADGSTNGEAGLRMAYEVAQDHFIEGGVNRIVMASDGDLNVGVTSESDLHDFVDQKRQSGVYLSVLGFGAGNYKDTKMETLADHGNGSYHYIDCEQEAKRVFGERLTANLVPFANDVKVQVEFNPAQVKGYRLIGYENRAMAAEDFENDEKDAGEVGPESQFTVAYEIVRADSALDVPAPELKYGRQIAVNSTDWLTATLRYAPVDGGDVRQVERVVDEQDVSTDPGEDWRFAAAVTEFGMLLRNSDYKGSATYDTVRDLVGQPADPLRQGLLELVDLAEHNA